ncbi:response regulator [Candidatus Woesearchaeota archaeon]|nr:response regulator [Candidatus Woesearchaeota archaeon]
MAKKILIVDDDPYLLNLAIRMLRRFGYETLSASNGDEALDIARRELPDLIFMDTEMPPGLMGFDVCSRLRQDGLSVKIMGCSGDIANGYEERWHAAGADDYLQRPYNYLKLREKIQQLLSEQ